MMKERVLKYVFVTLAALLLIVMLAVSRNAGITCDEVLHYDHSVSVYNYFASHGRDLSALDTPETHLKYYGQSYDNLVTIIIRWFRIDDVYGFRHLMSAFAGWLTIIVTALFAIWLTGYRAGIFVILLFAVSPTYLGHSLNNLKDIPFALGYISAVFLSLKLIFSGKNMSLINAALLTLSIALAISVRAGGMVLICYLFLLLSFSYLLKYLREKRVSYHEMISGYLTISGISVISFCLAILLWPYALQSPVKNVFESYNVMAHFPSTFRQIFEGREEWSDSMPWYYLIKSMAITIPLIVTGGLLIFPGYLRCNFHSDNAIKTGFVIFTVLFPVIFVIFEKSNLYSSWRQFLFLYPGIILISALGFSWLFMKFSNKYLRAALILVFVLLSIHPLKFMILNQRYWYVYYNQLVGGLNGANGNYETDYYYVSQTEASGWLLDYLKQKGKTNDVKVKATFSVKWEFRNYPGIQTSYFRFEDRSLFDWDYAIVTNRYIAPFKLKNGIWPPKDAIHLIYADSVPLCAVLERKTKSDFYGYEALNQGKVKEAIGFFEDALKENDKDEMIFFNFAAALIKDRQTEKADSILKEGLRFNPRSEMILMYLGNLAKSEKQFDDAKEYYQKLISVNRKYFEAYVSLSGLLTGKDIFRARELLRSCLKLNPGYKPAILALANTYRDSDPAVAKKYDELARRTK